MESATGSSRKTDQREAAVDSFLMIDSFMKSTGMSFDPVPFISTAASL